jgi:2',3'-cyclic-nucleotide 2'-phosphodiesterase (5'-nucleotidase family)
MHVRRVAGIHRDSPLAAASVQKYSQAGCTGMAIGNHEFHLEGYGLVKQESWDRNGF